VTYMVKWWTVDHICTVQMKSLYTHTHTHTQLGEVYMNVQMGAK